MGKKSRKLSEKQTKKQAEKQAKEQIKKQAEKQAKEQIKRQAEKQTKEQTKRQAEKQTKEQTKEQAEKHGKVQSVQGTGIEKAEKRKSGLYQTGSDRDRMEELLGAWMRMSIGIKGNRILKDLSFNEMVVCRLLYRARQEGREITATEICNHARLLKSQVNKLLGEMEKRELIYKHRDQEDKRRVFIRLREESLSVYLAEHEHVMSIIGQVCERLSDQEVEILIEKMSKVVAVMDEIEERDPAAQNLLKGP